MGFWKRILTGSLIDERRGVVYAVIFGIWGLVFVFCVLHDQYLVRIAPEHFTVYHPPLWGIRDPSWLGVAWAFRASVGPGLGLGLAVVFLGRGGPLPKMPVGLMLKVVAGLLVATELVAASAGLYAWQTGRLIYPEIIYPERTRPLVTTQTIQVSCYLAGALMAAGFLLWIGRWRRARARKSREGGPSRLSGNG